MELRVLQYFLAVAREQSISAAAESLHLSQPTLSTQLRQLEDELGKQLLIRGAKGSRRVTLTEEGVILRKRAEEILALVHRAEDEIARSDENIAGDVYIGAGEADIVRLFAEAAKLMQDRYPDVHYHITSGNAEHVLDQLDKGLQGRGLVGNLPKPAYPGNKSGKVVIRVTVDATGKVTSATFEPKGSTESDPALVSAAITAARKARFTESRAAVQGGTITYIFRME